MGAERSTLAMDEGKAQASVGAALRRDSRPGLLECTMAVCGIHDEAGLVELLPG
jgi:hypothetical protein